MMSRCLADAHDITATDLGQNLRAKFYLSSRLQVNDISLEDYIAVKSKNAVFVPHTAGRYQKKRFRKAQCPIVER